MGKNALIIYNSPGIKLFLFYDGFVTIENDAIIIMPVNTDKTLP